MKTKINSGTIVTKPINHHESIFIAMSNLEKQPGVFWTFNAAAFFLWLIETRVLSKRNR